MTDERATVVYVVYANDALDLSWLPDEAIDVRIVHNDGGRRTRVDGAARGLVVSHLVPDANLGFGRGVNFALRDVTRGRVVLVNPDAMLTRSHWEALARPSPDVVTVPLVDDSGVLTYTMSAYPSPVRHVLAGLRVGRIFRRGSRLRPVGDPPTVDDCRPLSTHWVSGAAMALPVERFHAVGGFDDAYFLYYEDMDLCRRLAEHDPTVRGCLLGVVPGIHAVGGSARGSRWVERVRLQSAIRWARHQRGPGWRAAALALQLRALLPR